MDGARKKGRSVMLPALLRCVTSPISWLLLPMERMPAAENAIWRIAPNAGWRIPHSNRTNGEIGDPQRCASTVFI